MKKFTPMRLLPLLLAAAILLASCAHQPVVSTPVSDDETVSTPLPSQDDVTESTEALTDPTETEPTDTEPTDDYEPDTYEPDSYEPDPTEPDPTETEATETEPTETEATEAETTTTQGEERPWATTRGNGLVNLERPWATATTTRKTVNNTTTTAAATTTTTTTTTATVTTKTSSSLPVNYDENLTPEDMIIFCMGDGSDNGDLATKEGYMPSVAYMENGEIKDMMFDTFLLSWIWHYMPVVTKSGIEGYWRQMMGYRGLNMNALNEAVGEAKEALNMPKYKANIFIGFWVPTTRWGTSFGVLDGKAKDCANLQDCKDIIDWQMETVIDMFNSKGYEHLRLVGFSCIEESFQQDNALYLSVQQYFTSSARERGILTNWGPYFHARGWNMHDEMGFDWNCYSPNYFKGGSPNGGDASRLQIAMKEINDEGIGLAYEMESYNKVSVGVLKEYMAAAVEYGCINTYHGWYMVNGARGVMYVYANEDPQIQSAYGDIYKTIKKTLDPSKMIMW